jgi:flagellar biosynthesis chaperone FliJ
MKRRSEGGLDDAVNMDVMMDNMTDVVGTLLMVLIIVQLKVNNTIDQIQSSLPKVTEEQTIEAQQHAEELAKQVQDMEQDWTERQPLQTKVAADLKTRQEDLLRVEVTLAKSGVNLLALDKLEEQLEARRKEVEAAKKDLASLIDQREQLKGLLDNTPASEVPPAQIVHMPQAREIPKEAELTRVLCAGSRVYLVDAAQMKKMALAAFNRSRKALVKDEHPPEKGQDMSVYDHEKTAALLEKRSLGNAEYDLAFPVIKTSERLRMEIRPKESAGESPDEFESVRSKFANMMRNVKRNPKGVVWFLVHPDSFDTYLKARELCDDVGVPAGWEVTGLPFFYEYLAEFKVNRLEDPPPPNPNAIAIPAPKKTID